MYIRTVKSRGYEYVQLAHNYRDPETGASRAKVLFNFGRKDQLDVEGLTRLVGSIARFLEKHDLASLPLVESDDAPFEFVGAKQLGGPWLLDGLWERPVSYTHLDVYKRQESRTSLGLHVEGQHHCRCLLYTSRCV